MKDLKYSLMDFPDDPTNIDWQKEALLFYYYMLTKEKKYEKKVQDILQRFKKIFESSEEISLDKRKAIYNELKNELYKIKDKDNSLGRSLGFIFLISKSINSLEDNLENSFWRKKTLEVLQKQFPSESIKKIIEKIPKNQEKMIIKAINELTRVIRTESWRYVNEQRLDEFRKKGYKYKTTYPVKDKRTGDDSWYYYDEHQIKLLDEPFSYTWQGSERIFMTPPDRPNDRNILIPYIKS